MHTIFRYQQIFFTLGLLIATTIILLSYKYFDIFIAQYCYSLNGTLIFKLFKSITILGDSLVYILIAIGGMLFYRYYYNQKETFEKYFFILQAIVISGIVVNIFKVLAGRYRPSRLFSDDLYGFDLFHTAHQMLSFPSGHTTTIFAFAASMAFLFPKSQKIWWILAFFVGISRVIINAHYLSDIIGGAFLGITTVIVILSNRNRFKLTSLA